MATNWAAGLIRWEPHRRSDGTSFSLNHLHPFRMEFSLEGDRGHPARTLQIHCAFSIHTFARDCEPGDDEQDFYRDNREVRIFCPARYRLSFGLPTIVRELGVRPCKYARTYGGDINYVTIDGAQGVRYVVFFDLMRWKDHGPDAILLMVQSAYEWESGKAEPGSGKISFKALLGHTIRGTKPKPPR